MEKKIRFVNAQKMKKQYPDSFYGPATKDLEALKPGDFVKVCAYQERFWAEVLEIEGQNVTARIDNDLITIKLSYNEKISFQKDHIYDIISFQKDHIYDILQHNKQDLKTGLKKDARQRKTRKRGL